MWTYLQLIKIAQCTTQWCCIKCYPAQPFVFHDSVIWNPSIVQYLCGWIKSTHVDVDDTICLRYKSCVRSWSVKLCRNFFQTHSGHCVGLHNLKSNLVSPQNTDLSRIFAPQLSVHCHSTPMTKEKEKKKRMNTGSSARLARQTETGAILKFSFVRMWGVNLL